MRYFFLFTSLILLSLIELVSAQEPYVLYQKLDNYELEYTFVQGVFQRGFIEIAVTKGELLFQREQEALLDEERYLYPTAVLLLEIYSQQWYRSSSVQQRNLEKKIESVKKVIKDEKLRSQLTITIQRQQKEISAELEPLAENAWKSGNIQEAIRLYDQAAEQALIQNNRKEAFRLSGRALGITDLQLRQIKGTNDQEEKSLKTELMNRFFDLGLKYPEEPLAEQFATLGLEQALVFHRTGELSLEDYLQYRIRWIEHFQKSQKYELFRFQTAILLLEQNRSKDAFILLFPNVQKDQLENTLSRDNANEYLQQLEHLRQAWPADPIFSSSTVRVLESDANLLLNKKQEALTILGTLLKENPEDINLYYKTALILSREQDVEALQTAIHFWNEVVKRTNVTDVRSWQAKEAIIKLYRQLGEEERAQKMVRLILLTWPEKGDSLWKKRFEELKNKP